MGFQSDTFKTKEADAWFRRNQGSLRQDPISPVIESMRVNPTRILEIGSSDGWRLEALRKRYNAECTGVDPSSEAVESGLQSYPDLKLVKGTADDLPFADDGFDLVILGFCLYVCDRTDLFSIAAEVDRVLVDQGHLIILDFHTTQPYRNEYSHLDGLNSYKMDYTQMFVWNPIYHQVFQKVFGHGDESVINVDDRVGVSMLMKNCSQAFPRNPF